MLASTGVGRKRRSRVIAVAIVLALIFAVWAGVRAILPEPCLISDEAAEPYIGLTVLQAEAKAAKDGYVIRVLGRDGQCLGGTDDLRVDRINVQVQDSRVVRAAAF